MKSTSTVAASRRNACFEYALDRILGEQDVRMLDITDPPCIEIDFPKDLDRARNEVAPRIARRSRP